MTTTEARAILRDLGLSIRKTPGVPEYRVNYAGGPEGTAYYTSDLADAVSTGRAMATRSITRAALSDGIDAALDRWARRYPEVPSIEVQGIVSDLVGAYLRSVERENEADGAREDRAAEAGR
jgi:hypothetical protein